MHLHQMGIRRWDKHGDGIFGASRGSRPHNGLDLMAKPNESVQSPVEGRVTKLGYTYKDDLSYRYVQVTCGGYDYRVFYIDPIVKLGTLVQFGSVLGLVQDLGTRYEGITNHVHFEIKDGNAGYVDPTPVYWALKCVSEDW